MKGYRHFEGKPQAAVLHALVWLDEGEEHVAAGLHNLLVDMVAYSSPTGIRAWSVAGLADEGQVGYACWPEDSEEFERRIGEREPQQSDVSHAFDVLRQSIEWRYDDAPHASAAAREEYDESVAALDVLRKAVRG